MPSTLNEFLEKALYEEKKVNEKDDKLGEYNIDNIKKSLSIYIKDLQSALSNMKKGNYIDAFKKMNSTQKGLNDKIKFIKKRLNLK